MSDAVAKMPNLAEETFLCCTCRKMKPMSEKQNVRSEDVITGTSQQFRCKPCANLRKRVDRVTSGMGCDTLANAFSDMSAEDKATFYKQAATLCGEDLKKQMTAVATKIAFQKTAMDCDAKGDFVKETDLWQDVKDGKRKQADVETLCANSHKFFSNEYQCDMVWGPKYHMRLSHHASSSTERKAAVDSVQTTKPPPKKRIKREAAAEADGAAAAPAGGPAAEPAAPPSPNSQPLPRGMATKLTQASKKIGEFAVALQAALNEASAPEAIARANGVCWCYRVRAPFPMPLVVRFPCPLRAAPWPRGRPAPPPAFAPASAERARGSIAHHSPAAG